MFFYQAEDGIRDYKVTGVQTCALPISVPTEVKIAFVDALSAAGFDEIEVSSFVSPKWIPQLADAEAVFAGIRRAPGVTYMEIGRASCRAREEIALKAA